MGTARPRPPPQSYSATDRPTELRPGEGAAVFAASAARGEIFQVRKCRRLRRRETEGGGAHVVQHWQHLLDVDKGSARNRYGHRRRRRPFGDCRQSSRRTFGQFCSRCLRSDIAEARRSNGSCKLLSCIATIARTDGMQVTDLLANFGRCDVWRIGGTIHKKRPQKF